MVGMAKAGSGSTGGPLVTVVIPCFNHAAYLAEAVESVLAQSYSQVEIVVVDDGSTDGSATVAAQFPTVILVRQPNAGLSAARNAGIRASSGDLLTFLDADDRLLPDAIQTGVERLTAHPEWAFVSGAYRDIDAAGMPARPWPHVCPDGDHYLGLLRAPYIAMHATVLFRRNALEQAGGYDVSLRACEDYDLYLRVARRWPVGCHCQVVAEYRQHGENMTRDAARMLQAVMQVMRREAEYAAQDQSVAVAHQEGVRFWRAYYGRRLARELGVALVGRQWRRAAQSARALLRDAPAYLPQSTRPLAEALRGIVGRFFRTARSAWPWPTDAVLRGAP